MILEVRAYMHLYRDTSWALTDAWILKDSQPTNDNRKSMSELTYSNHSIEGNVLAHDGTQLYRCRFSVLPILVQRLAENKPSPL